MTIRMMIAGLLIAAPALAGTAYAGSDVAKPAAVGTPQSTPVPSATEPSASPMPSTIDKGYESGYPGGCPFGHEKTTSAATS
ncbi:MAG: hypothetical protein AAGI06_16880 [Pseudomonadota bacterium]